MSLQKLVTKRYLSLHNYPTLKTISKDTGVQITRAFRILNGSSMKLSEYEVFNKRIRAKMSSLGLLENLVEECSLKLSPIEIDELNAILNKKLKLISYKEK
ncbi:MAG: hypothetical protein DRQ89_11920 [Epsilonproteobacteria bacterium]|nr:MAG: hypothetical protein DRQ89_11920 [Campylobacterota bacterium]